MRLRPLLLILVYFVELADIRQRLLGLVGRRRLRLDEPPPRVRVAG
jgi:hypothetical protein